LNNDETAKDLVQDSLVKIFKNLEKFDKEKGDFKVWITTITIRLCLTKLKKRKLAVLNIDDFLEADSMASVDQLALDNLHTKYLIEMIKELPDGYREVFNMAAIDGYSHGEIAEHLNITEQVSRARLSRARKKIILKIENQNKQELWVNSI